MTFADIVSKFIGGGSFDRTLAEQGAKEVIDLLPPSYLMRYAPSPIDLVSGATQWTHDIGSDSNCSHISFGGPETKRLLKVLRNDGSQWRECSEVDFMGFSEADNSNSIYKTTENAPVYNVDKSGGYTKLTILPTITGSAGLVDSGKVIYVPYPDFTNAEALGNWINPYEDSTSPEILFKFRGFSVDTMNVIGLKAAIYTTQSLISEAVQEDEDNELLAMLNAQQGSLNAQYEMDMKRLMGATG